MAQINAALGQQAMRLEQLAQDERNRRAEASRKRSLPASEETGSDPKRPKIENQPEAGPSIASVLSSFDFRTLPAALIIELIIANLTALSATTLQTAVAVMNIHAFRRLISDRSIESQTNDTKSGPSGPFSITKW